MLLLRRGGNAARRHIYQPPLMRDMHYERDSAVKWNGKRRTRNPAHTAEREARQSMITHLAFTLLGGRDRAVLFLNTRRDPLGGTRLDRAMVGADNYAEVEEELRRVARPTIGTTQ